MSAGTVIPDAHADSEASSRTVTILGRPGGGHVTVLAKVATCVKVPDFLAAVASELNVRIVPADAIVIERSELPAVRVEDDRFITGDASWPQRLARQNVDAIRQDALQNLALAEYLTANPRVDRALVVALISAFAESGARIEGAVFEDVARALAGRVQVTS